MLEALIWGAIAASSLVIGAGLGLMRQWPARQVGIVLAFGAGALISAVSFELAEEGLEVGGAGWLGLGLAIGALSYFFASRRLEAGPRRADGGHRPPSRTHPEAGGRLIALGATLDGVPEQLVLGIGLAADGSIGASLIAAIFISNISEGMASASQMRAGGSAVRSVIGLWLLVAAIVTAASGVGYSIEEFTDGAFAATVNGFAAGALLVMLVDSMVPEARKSAGRIAGLVSVLGFALATGLSNLS